MYCQHVFGIGHFVRTLTIAKAVSKRHHVVVISGGLPVPVPEDNEKVKFYWLDPICSDENYERYYSAANKNVLYEDIYPKRLAEIKEIINNERPDAMWIEGFPFARRRFKKEIISAIKHARRVFPSCMICSSVRDALLKYGGDSDYNNFVTDELNGYFDILFIHSDPKKIKLDLTFAGINHVKIPTVYTGYVARKPLDCTKRTWSEGGYVVASCGGSSIYSSLILHAVNSQLKHFPERTIHVFSGLRSCELRIPKSDKTVMHNFTWNYIDFLSHAAVSISMGGYNSIVESIACEVPSIVIPLHSNDEQKIRLKYLDDCNNFEIVDFKCLEENMLYEAVKRVVSKDCLKDDLDLDGANFVANYFK